MKKKMITKIVIVFVLLIVAAVPFSLRVKGESTIKYEKIVVYPGDTLWSIAKDNLKGNKDIRKVIYDIKKINKLQSSIISPGQELLIPLK